MHIKRIILVIIAILAIIFLASFFIQNKSFTNLDLSLEEVNKSEIAAIKNNITMTSMGSQDYPDPLPFPRYILDENTLQLKVIPQSQYDWKSSGQTNVDPFQKNIVIVAKCKKIRITLSGEYCAEYDILFADMGKQTIRRILTSYQSYAIGFNKNSVYIIIGRGSGKDQIIDKNTYMFKLVIQ